MSGRDLALAASAGAGVAVILERLISAFLSRTSNTKAPGNASRTKNQAQSTLWRPTPHPSWHPPQKLPPPYGLPSEAEMHSIDPSNYPTDALYALVISAVVPRPIAFISTIGTDGSGNLAPYSYFNVLSHNPPYVAIGCCANAAKQEGKKDSLYNILATKEFVVNIISEWFMEAANHCCGAFDYGVNEMELSGLTPVPSAKIAPPRVGESACQMECVLRHTYDIKDAGGKVTTTIIIGQVVLMHIADGVAGKSPSGKLIVDIEKYKPMSRLGGNIYGRAEGLFELPRPDRKV